jgi:hypothetical protein
MIMVSLTKSSGDDESNLELTCISELTPDSRSVSVLLKIISMSQTRQVRSSKTSRRHLVQNVVVGDSTARINMTLWNEDADSLQEGQTYLLTKGYVREYDECGLLQDENHNEGDRGQNLADHSEALREERKRDTAHGRAFESVIRS